MISVDDLVLRCPVAFPDHLRGTKAFLRPFEASDGPALWDATEEVRSDATFALTWQNEVRTPQDARWRAAMLRSLFMARNALHYAIEDAATGNLAGGCGVWPGDWSCPVYDLYVWLRPAARGRGIATDAVRLLTYTCVDKLKAMRVSCQMDMMNLPAFAVAQRVPFKMDALLANVGLNAANQPINTAIFSLVSAYRGQLTPEHDKGMGSASHPLTADTLAFAH